MGNDDHAYTVSISFRKKHQPKWGYELVTGYLDDLFILSFGLEDYTSHFVEVGVEEVLQDHRLCGDIIHGRQSFRRWRFCISIGVSKSFTCNSIRCNGRAERHVPQKYVQQFFNTLISKLTSLIEANHICATMSSACIAIWKNSISDCDNDPRQRMYKITSAAPHFRRDHFPLQNSLLPAP